MVKVSIVEDSYQAIQHEEFVCYSRDCSKRVEWLVRYGTNGQDFTFTCQEHAKYVNGITYVRKEYIEQYLERHQFNVTAYIRDWNRNHTNVKQKTTTPKFETSPVILKGTLSW